MIRRIIAALAALILAAVGVFIVINYANNADERAMEGLETVDVLVATQPIPAGTSAVELGNLVEVQQVPAKFAVDGAVEDLGDLGERVVTTSVSVGEQIIAARFATPDEIRAGGDFVLPEEAEGLHQLTINLSNPQALGGSIAPGDTVGLFATYELEPPTGWIIGPNGELLWDSDTATADDGSGSGEEDADGDSGAAGDASITFTDLVLDKVLVVRVEGGYVAPNVSTADEESGEAEGEQAQDTIHVTIALAPQDAARVIQTMQTGTVWLTLSPEAADEADVDAVVPAAPSRVTGVIE